MTHAWQATHMDPCWEIQQEAKDYEIIGKWYWVMLEHACDPSTPEMEERGWGIQCQSKLQWIVRKKKNLKRWLRPQSFVLCCFLLFQLSLIPRQLLLAWLPCTAIWYLFIKTPFLKIWLCIHCDFEDFTHYPPTRQMQKGEISEYPHCTLRGYVKQG